MPVPILVVNAACDPHQTNGSDVHNLITGSHIAANTVERPGASLLQQTYDTEHQLIARLKHDPRSPEPYIECLLMHLTNDPAGSHGWLAKVAACECDT